MLPVDHRVGVDLTHVPAPVALLDAVEVEIPLVLPGPRQGDPGVAGDHVVVDGEDGLGVHPDPGNLRQTSIILYLKIFQDVLAPLQYIRKQSTNVIYLSSERIIG